MKESEEALCDLTTQTLLSLREHLITNLVKDEIDKAQELTNNGIEFPEETKIVINEYNSLRVKISRSLGRIRAALSNY